MSDRIIEAVIPSAMHEQLAAAENEVIEFSYLVKLKSGLKMRGTIGLDNHDRSMGKRIHIFRLTESLLHSLMIARNLFPKHLDKIPAGFVVSVAAYTDGPKMMMNGEFLESIVVESRENGVRTEWVRHGDEWSPQVPKVRGYFFSSSPSS